MPPKKNTEENTDRLDNLISMLEKRLQLLCPNAMKEKMVEVVRTLNQKIEELETIKDEFMRLLDCNYQDIHL